MSGRLSAAIRRCSTSRPLERGAVAVEFALVLPILVILLLGVVSVGVSYSRALGVTNAVREGARFGATTMNGIGWEAAVVGRTRQTLFDDNGTTTRVCAQLLKNAVPSGSPTPTVPAVPTATLQATATCAAGPAPTPPAVDPEECVAMVWASRDFRIDIGLASPWTGETRRRSVARYERPC